MATQRLSTLALADRVVVLDDGEVVETGTPAELLAARRRLHRAVRRGRRCGVSRRPACAGLRRHVDERRGWLALLLACAVVEAFAQSGSWLLVRLAINEGIVPGDEHVLALATAAYLAVSVIGLALFGFVIRGMARFGQELVLGLRRELFDHLTSLSLRYFSEQRAGWIIARLTSDVDAISDVLSSGLPTLVTNAVLLPAAVTALFINDWRLALVALVVLPPALVLTRWFQRRSSAAQLEVRNRIGGVTAHLAESVAGMAVVQSFRREDAFRERFDELNGANRERQRRTRSGSRRCSSRRSSSSASSRRSRCSRSAPACCRPARSARWPRRTSCSSSCSSRCRSCRTSTASCSRRPRR